MDRVAVHWRHRGGDAANISSRCSHAAENLHKKAFPVQHEKTCVAFACGIDLDGFHQRLVKDSASQSARPNTETRRAVILGKSPWDHRTPRSCCNSTSAQSGPQHRVCQRPTNSSQRSIRDDFASALVGQFQSCAPGPDSLCPRFD